MAARPADLARGRGTAPGDAQAAAAAVDRLRRDRVKPIGDTNGGGGGGLSGGVGAGGLTGS